MLKFWNKSALFGYFYVGILKNCSRIWNQNPEICLFAKSHEKIKIPKFRTKSSLFGYFWAWILKKLLSFLKSAPSNLSISKILRKKKCLNWRKFGNKSALFDYFCARLLKNYSRISNQHPQIYLFPKFPEKKMSKLGTKVPYLAIFGLEL